MECGYIKTDGVKSDVPEVIFKMNCVRSGRCKFLVKTGVGISVLKIGVMIKGIRVNTKKIISFNGFTTLGTVNVGMCIGNKEIMHEFHLVPLDFEMEQMGILGRDFFKINEAQINFETNSMNLFRGKDLCIIKMDEIVGGLSVITTVNESEVEKKSENSMQIDDIKSLNENGNSLNVKDVSIKSSEKKCFINNGLNEILERENGKNVLMQENCENFKNKESIMSVLCNESLNKNFEKVNVCMTKVDFVKGVEKVVVNDFNENVKNVHDVFKVENTLDESRVEIKKVFCERKSKKNVKKEISSENFEKSDDYFGGLFDEVSGNWLCKENFEEITVDYSKNVVKQVMDSKKDLKVYDDLCCDESLRKKNLGENFMVRDLWVNEENIEKNLRKDIDAFNGSKNFLNCSITVWHDVLVNDVDETQTPVLGMVINKPRVVDYFPIFNLVGEFNQDFLRKHIKKVVTFDIKSEYFRGGGLSLGLFNGSQMVQLLLGKILKSFVEKVDVLCFDICRGYFVENGVGLKREFEGFYGFVNQSNLDKDKTNLNIEVKVLKVEKVNGGGNPEFYYKSANRYRGRKMVSFNFEKNLLGGMFTETVARNWKFRKKFCTFFFFFW